VRDDRERLLDILDAIKGIEKYARRGEAAFRHDELVQNWMVRHLEVIGEAARALSEGLRARYVAIPWSDIIDMRNVLVHQYFGIDLDLVWQVVSTDVPDLKRRVTAILDETGHEP